MIIISGIEIGVKMSKSPTVVVDADIIIAQNNPADALHDKAKIVAQKLETMGARLIYPATTVAEAVTYIQRPLNSPASAYDTAQLLSQEADIVEVNQQTISSALKYFSPTASKKNTLFDCIVATIAEENNADAIFSFDKFYKSKGFKLASEL